MQPATGETLRLRGNRASVPTSTCHFLPPAGTAETTRDAERLRQIVGNSPNRSYFDGTSTPLRPSTVPGPRLGDCAGHADARPEPHSRLRLDQHTPPPKQEGTRSPTHKLRLRLSLSKSSGFEKAPAGSIPPIWMLAMHSRQAPKKTTPAGPGLRGTASTGQGERIYPLMLRISVTASPAISCNLA